VTDADFEKLARQRARSNRDPEVFVDGAKWAFDLLGGEDVTIHVAPHYPAGACKHEWAYDGECGEPTNCKLCGMSFIRHIHTECP
jgi:hypothetical protein